MITHIISKIEMSTLGKKNECNDMDTDRCITEAEVHDIVPVIGANLYNAMSNAQSDYSELLEGCTFTDVSGASRLFLGLKRAVAYYAESRIIRSANVQLTKFGAVLKQDEYSDGSNQARLNQESNYLKACADEIMEVCKAYLVANKSNALYKDYFVKPTNSGRQDYVKVRAIGE